MLPSMHFWPACRFPMPHLKLLGNARVKCLLTTGLRYLNSARRFSFVSAPTIQGTQSDNHANRLRIRWIERNYLPSSIFTHI